MCVWLPTVRADLAQVGGVRGGKHAPHMDVQDVCSPLFPACLAALQVIAGLSNSFGFGGHNSAVVFAPFEA